MNETMESLGNRPALGAAAETVLGRLFKFIGDMIGAGARGVVVALMLIFFVAQAHVVHGHSMEPTIHPEQRLIVEKLSYRFSLPHRGDVVVILRDMGQERLIKRVVGLPGEVLEVRQGQLYVNGRLINEPYLSQNAGQPDFAPVTVPPNHVFVLGDNRNNSNDSRYFGAVALDQISGRAWLTYWPFSELQLIQ